MKKEAIWVAPTIAFMLSVAAWAQTNDRDGCGKPSIQVSGTGVMHVKPDIASISIGVTTEDSDAEASVKKNNAAAAKVVSVLEAASLEKKDIQTGRFSVFPQYRTDNDKHQIVTYRASNTVNVTVRDLAKVGDVLTKAVSAGSNQISGPQFSISDPEKYLDEARRNAVANAMSKASTYATTAGLKLGQILSIVEDASSALAARIHTATNYARLTPVPVEAGEDTLQAQVTIIVELKS